MLSFNAKNIEDLEEEARERALEVSVEVTTAKRITHFNIYLI